jgi:hypothetical protein
VKHILIDWLTASQKTLQSKVCHSNEEEKKWQNILFISFCFLVFKMSTLLGFLRLAINL